MSYDVIVKLTETDMLWSTKFKEYLAWLKGKEGWMKLPCFWEFASRKLESPHCY